MKDKIKNTGLFWRFTRYSKKGGTIRPPFCSLGKFPFYFVRCVTCNKFCIQVTPYADFLRDRPLLSFKHSFFIQTSFL